MNFSEFLELSEDQRYAILTGNKLSWWQKLEVKLINKWWSMWRKSNPNLRAIELWESLYKRRF